MTLVATYRSTIAHFLGPIRGLMDDPEVTEVMVVGHHTVYCERAGKITLADAAFDSEDALDAALQNIAEFCNRRLDAEHHSMDGRLPGGERVHAVIPPCSRIGACLTIRKFQKNSFDLGKLVARESLTDAAAEFLQLAVMMHRNIAISGGTGTGKTSFLNALSASIPESERIVVIEDSSELQLHQPHTVYLEAQQASPDQVAVTIRDLFVDSLRMRPDRIIVGEVRQGEALDLVQSMLSGHAGSLSTVHANTPRDALTRLETLCLMSDTQLPLPVARVQVASAIDLVAQLGRLGDGSRRVTAITECNGLDEKGQYQWTDLFRFKAEGRDSEGRIQGRLRPTGAKPTFAETPYELGLDEQIDHSAGLFTRPESF